MSLVYLASPYSHIDPGVREARFLAVCEYAAKMMRDGIHVYSPIAHTHPIAQFGLPKEWEFWEQFDRKLLAVCDRVVVLMLDGWQQSKGVQAEIVIAGDLEIPVEFVLP